MTRSALAIFVVLAFLASALTGLRLLQARQARRVRAAIDALGDSTDGAPPPHHGAPSDLDSLPLPVQRYLQLALPADAPMPARVVLRQHGALRRSTTDPRWLPFTATHTVAPGGPGFVWDAEVRALPAVCLRVLDALAQGQGSGSVSLLSALPVGHAGGGIEMNAGTLHRFLAEAVWYPWALWPSDHLAWSAIDRHRALATLTERGVSVSLEFRFLDSGEVAGVFTPGRWGSFDGHCVQRPWEGRFADYHRRDGVPVPGFGEVGWYDGDRLAWVWRGRVDEVSFRSAVPPSR